MFQTETTDFKLPIFTWEVKNLSKYPFYMKIDFQDSKDPDIALLMPIMVNGSADISILRGSLKNERPIVEIAVNGRPNSTTFDVIFPNFCNTFKRIDSLRIIKFITIVHYTLII